MKEQTAEFAAASQDAVETPIGAAEGCGRDAVTREVCRGVGRLLRALNVAIINELMLPNGRRADVVGLSPAGDIWIVEVKSSIEDFRVEPSGRSTATFAMRSSSPWRRIFPWTFCLPRPG